MNESILDRILTELGKNGTDRIEATDEVMESMKLKNTSPIHSNEIEFLINQGHVHRDITPYHEYPGGFHPARYYLRLTPQGLKFITEGGFTAKSNYVKKTLIVATQSRNWAIVGVVIALIALGISVYYGSCNNSVTKPSTSQIKAPTYNDTIIKNADTLNKKQDFINTKNTDSLAQKESMDSTTKKKKKSSSNAK